MIFNNLKLETLKFDYCEESVTEYLIINILQAPRYLKTIRLHIISHQEVITYYIPVFYLYGAVLDGFQACSEAYYARRLILPS